MEVALKISTEQVKELRELSGAGVMDCKNVLVETGGDTDRALEILKQKNLARAVRKADRPVSQGIVEAYIHPGAGLGAMVEVLCETDFVARTDEFKELAHQLAMQVAAMDPQFISAEDIAEESDGDGVVPEAVCLLLQPYIKDPSRAVRDIINETIAKVGENIKVSRFARFALDR